MVQVLTWFLRQTSSDLQCVVDEQKRKAYVKGRKMKTKASKRDPLGHPFFQFWMSLAMLGCIWGGLRAKGVISKKLFEKGVSTESFLELSFH